MEVLPKCIHGNRAVNICIDHECGHPNPFICANYVNNQCKQLHTDCIIADWTNINKKILKVKQPNYPDFIKLSSAVEQTIQKSIKYLQRQLQYFNVWKSRFGKDAINLFKNIQNNQEHTFSGKQMAQILKDAKAVKEIKIQNQANINNQIKEVLKEMQKTQKMIREMYSVWDVPEEKVQQMKVYKIQQAISQNVPKLSLKM